MWSSVERTLSRRLSNPLFAALERNFSFGAVSATSTPWCSGQTVTAWRSAPKGWGARTYADLPAHQELTMPALSPTMETGNIAKWHVKEGDAVAAGDVIADIETDKAIMGFEIQDDGVIAKFLRPEGAQGVRVGEPVCIMVEAAADVAAFKDYKGGEAAAAKPSPAAASDAGLKASSTAAASPNATPRGPRSDRVGPAVRKLLAENGLTQFDVSPTGPRDIVTKGDVLAAVAAGVKHGGAAAPAPAPAAPKAPAAAARPAAAQPAAAPARPSPPPAAAAFESAGPTSGRRARGETFRDIPHTQMRRIIAKRLLESKLTTPSIYVSQDAGLAALTQLRAALKEAGTKLSVNDFVIKAAALALRAVPGVCAGWDAKAGAPVTYDNVDISVAVATPGGLITPIVTAADAKSLPEISAAVKDLAGRARENKLAPHEFTGGSFTISNLGMYGISSFAAIINPPQACILAVGGSQHKTVMQEGSLIDVEHMTVTLSADNRVVDEETAAHFLQVFAKHIENPGMMLMN